MKDRIETIVLPLIIITITASTGTYFFLDSNSIAGLEYESWFYQWHIPALRGTLRNETTVQEITKNHTIPQLAQNPFKFQRDAWLTISTMFYAFSIFAIIDIGAFRFWNSLNRDNVGRRKEEHCEKGNSLQGGLSWIPPRQEYYFAIMTSVRSIEHSRRQNHRDIGLRFCC
jgi:hypothetical protein